MKAHPKEFSLLNGPDIIQGYGIFYYRPTNDLESFLKHLLYKEFPIQFSFGQ
jgi:hypothetical protein